ncbi:MAG: AsnC family protein [Candidatus Accumulibacter sp. 66-26]|nr:AsnC family transcriptional regulator [Accumulibacter sp.]OJW48679.1 MAG: AsnC family protein [Candidatus Accumulibacter sp. 66-26]
MREAARIELDAVDRAIIDRLQGDFPICERPYLEAAEVLGIGEDELLARLRRLLDARVLTRFGPMFQIERMGGAFVLAAMRVPEADWERVLAVVNAFPEVAHNYRRTHELNMWFVLATETPGGIADTVARLEAASGLPVYPFPKLKEYFVEMKLEVRT